MLHSTPTKGDFIEWLKPPPTEELLARFDDLSENKPDALSERPSDIAQNKALGLLATELNTRPTLK